MQKWEYKIIYRYRGWEPKKPFENPENGGIIYPDFYAAGVWNTDDYDDKKFENIEDFLSQLGDQGWELISIIGESNFLGGYQSTSIQDGIALDFAGFTNVEKLWFKRPKE